jgi:hypothetical protein
MFTFYSLMGGYANCIKCNRKIWIIGKKTSNCICQKCQWKRK